MDEHQNVSRLTEGATHSMPCNFLRLIMPLANKTCEKSSSSVDLYWAVHDKGNGWDSRGRLAGLIKFLGHKTFSRLTIY